MATCVNAWTADSGTMDFVPQNERTLLEVKGRTSGAVTIVWLTYDGTDSGTNYFAVTDAPMVRVIMQDAASAGTFGQAGFSGPLLANTQQGYTEQYQVLWEWDTTATAWKVYIYLVGQLSTSESHAANAGKTFILYAVGGE